ncbi:hypothetical protein GCM10009097_26500 [Pigmentiphaga daeguensis]|uniref:Uncharacterized protein n=1 Tax=Pigmentiphaga daeguensis TaxID=414049 RepID=A0ABP3LVH9_9BURK
MFGCSCQDKAKAFQDGKRGSRNGEIHWAQEMLDQGGMMRELVKWDSMRATWKGATSTGWPPS